MHTAKRRVRRSPFSICARRLSNSSLRLRLDPTNCSTVDPTSETVFSSLYFKPATNGSVPQYIRSPLYPFRLFDPLCLGVRLILCQTRLSSTYVVDVVEYKDCTDTSTMTAIRSNARIERSLLLVPATGQSDRRASDLLSANRSETCENAFRNIYLTRFFEHKADAILFSIARLGFAIEAEPCS